MINLKIQLYKYYSNYNTNNTFTQIKSNRIISDIINNIFIKIFKILDSDEDDLISPITITNSIKNIPLKIKKILQNFFDEFQRSNINLKKENFVEIMKDIYNNLDNFILFFLSSSILKNNFL